MKGRPRLTRRKHNRAALRVAMTLSGISGARLQRELEKRGVSLSQTTVYNWMREDTTSADPSPAVMGHIAQILGRRPAYFYRAPSRRMVDR